MNFVKGTNIVELNNDIFCLGFIFILQKNLQDNYKKEILGYFLLFYSSIFCEEVLKVGYGKINEKLNFSPKDIKKIRNYNLKYCPSSKSTSTIKTIEEMGISFNTYVFDIILSLNNNELIDINLKNWEFNKKENFDIINGIVFTSIRWIEILLPNIYDNIEKLFTQSSKKIIEKTNNHNITKKSYSTYKMFENSRLNNDEKLYILHRYGLIKCVLFINDIIDDTSFLHPFDFKLFITKCRAILIELLWNDLKSNNSLNILKTIFEKNKSVIPDKFYATNRKCRNNLHYSHYSKLSKEELNLLSTYQEKYLNTFLNTFDDNITLNFGMLYNISLSLAKLRYWSQT